MVYFGKLTDEEEDVPGFLMRYFKAVPRYNPRVADISSAGPAAARQLSLHTAVNEPVLTALGYLHHAGTEDAVKAISHWIAADLCTQVFLLAWELTLGTECLRLFTVWVKTILSFGFWTFPLTCTSPYFAKVADAAQQVD